MIDMNNKLSSSLINWLYFSGRESGKFCLSFCSHLYCCLLLAFSVECSRLKKLAWVSALKINLKWIHQINSPNGSQFMFLYTFREGSWTSTSGAIFATFLLNASIALSCVFPALHHVISRQSNCGCSGTNFLICIGRLYV